MKRALFSLGHFRAVDGMIRPSDEASADDIAERGGQQTVKKRVPHRKSRGGDFVFDACKKPRRKEIHIRNAVLETADDEGQNGQVQRKNFARRGVTRHRRPHCKADEHIAENAS